MTVAANQVAFYGAAGSDYASAVSAAEANGVPMANVTGDFNTAATWVENGTYLVIAVGHPANLALFWNSCGWNTSAYSMTSYPACHTPFDYYSIPYDGAIVAGLFESADGVTARDSLQLAMMLGHYAIYGAYPQYLPTLPTDRTLSGQTCSTSDCTGSSSNSCPTTASKPTGGDGGGVGVYAGFGTETDVTDAINEGWAGVAATGALGTQTSPYTAELSSHPDENISNALDSTSGNVFWLSFWTVSWPASGDTFYNAGYQAGKYAANTILGYNGKYVPNYMVIDPEGYNTAASTDAEWADWINGWVAGIAAVSSELTAGFYVNQSQYTTYNLASLTAPAFIAVSPIGGNTPEVKGGNIIGYIAYYASCPVSSNISTVAGWGAKFNTVQFSDSAVDCAP